MALVKLPPLPEGIPPFYSLWKSSEGYMIICGNDKLVYHHSVYSEYNGWSYGNYLVTDIKYCYKYDNTNKEWKKDNYYRKYDDSYYFQYNGYSLVFTNYNIKDYENTGQNKWDASPKTTDIKVSCGEFLEMNKGMVWDIGQAVTLEPLNTFQACNFKSSNPDICKVTEDGKIIAVGDGECVITITSKL
ncbi:hypothetical protein [Clostridium perfringens]|uniref:hypothetical protein n=1 Tax=Clostridium perfringens TaxID=1502 RepID=UPI000BBB5E2E|nr:hypothetical protein [Clostridium perfringens]